MWISLELYKKSREILKSTDSKGHKFALEEAYIDSLVNM